MPNTQSVTPPNPTTLEQWLDTQGILVPCVSLRSLQSGHRLLSFGEGTQAILFTVKGNELIPTQVVLDTNGMVIL